MTTTVKEIDPIGEIAGKSVKRYVIEQPSGFRVTVFEYGATIQSLEVPVNGKLRDVVLGLDSLQAYQEQDIFLGAIVGRYANRIANAEFELNGKIYKLNPNEGKNQLHGGSPGFHQKHWSSEIIKNGVRFSLFSPDGEQGYPGNLDVHVDYICADPHTLEVSIRGDVDAECPVNLTQHAYFNLNGADSKDGKSQYIRIETDRFLKTDQSGIPTGFFEKCSESNRYFRKEKLIRHSINRAVENRSDNAGGFDECYTFSDTSSKLTSSKQLASLKSFNKDLQLILSSDQPGLQFYTGQHIDQTRNAELGRTYEAFDGVCLEPQLFPAGPNIPEFNNETYSPTRRYEHKSKYKFD